MSCEHNNRRITRRVLRGGGIRYCFQCMECGSQVSEPIAHRKVLSEHAEHEIAPYDESLEAEVSKRRVAAALATREAERREFRAKYAKYLAGPEWALKRRQVMHRCAGVCEGCGIADATEVHHLTYKHVGEEFLFELVGVCKPCHERAHADKDERPSA